MFRCYLQTQADDGGKSRRRSLSLRNPLRVEEPQQERDGCVHRPQVPAAGGLLAEVVTMAAGDDQQAGARDDAGHPRGIPGGGIWSPRRRQLPRLAISGSIISWQLLAPPV
jgi:hypothetical protein